LQHRAKAFSEKGKGQTIEGKGENEESKGLMLVTDNSFTLSRPPLPFGLAPTSSE